MKHDFKHEQLPSGKLIYRHFEDGSLVEEYHTYGVLEIGIRYEFEAGVKIAQSYFAKRRTVGRRTYEEARIAYPDMPPADASVEDLGALLLRGARKQERQNKAEAESRLARSAESRFPRPTSTNWLRVITGDKAIWFSSPPGTGRFCPESAASRRDGSGCMSSAFTAPLAALAAAGVSPRGSK